MTMWMKLITYINDTKCMRLYSLTIILYITRIFHVDAIICMDENSFCE
jgi:hypothetical protein